ncbi:ankyrin repeat harbouring exported protein [Chrysochromulina tobinii]|uniref:Ankyrin repeat harbouring exported protein n=1 Tax=Chrysochromulina tobinii TaxID=1460289 RepID=A0A0M0JK94_9EUKA|nr:ankyrin repeat harbouring exported protein [Chrysochromulina tobinii]|eukprot:KOO26910.1 ankyrin repeat harbouring exported protein [Chrysochromulina sp. CCMP291]
MATKLEAAIAAQAQLQRQLAQLTAQLEEAKAAFKGRPPRQLFVEAVQRNSSAPAQSAESPRKQALRTLGLRTPPSDKLPQAPEGAPCASPMSVAPSALVSSGGTRSQAVPPASEVVPASPAKGASGAPDGAGTVKRLSRELASTLSPAKLAPSAGQVRGSPFLVAKGARSSDASAPPPRQPPVVSSGGPGEGGGAISPTEMSFIQLKKFLFSHPRVPRDEVSGATSRAPLLALVDKYGLGSASGSTSGSTSISGSISISGSTSGSTSSSTAKAADTSAAAMAPPPSTGAASTGIASMGVAREGGAVRPRYSALDEAPSTADALRHSACGLDGIDAAGRTALIIASANGHTDVAKALIAGGADLEKVTFGGETATMAACSNGHADTLALLLDARASVAMVEALNCDGQSALMLATNEAHEGVAAMLVRRGRRAPNSPEDSTGSSPGSELWI